MQASVVIGKATAILQDVGDQRISASDKLGLFNSAQRLLVLLRPDAKTTRGLITLVDGVNQVIPTGGLRLIRIVRNDGGRGVSLVSEETLSDFDPSWYTATAASVVKHYVFDPLEPKRFDVYPPAVSGSKVLGVWSTLPTDATSSTDPIDVDDIFEMPLVYLLCHLAYIRDGQEPESQQLATMHMNNAVAALTGQFQSGQRTDPSTSQPERVAPMKR